MGLGAASHPLSPPVVDDGLQDLSARTIETIEGARCDVPVELGAVVSKGLAEVVEYLDRRAARVRCSLKHERRHCADEDRFGHATFPMQCNITCDLAVSSRVSDMDCVS